MCFPKKPEPDKAQVAYSQFQNAELSRQRAEAEDNAAEIKHENKQTREEDALALLSGRIGRRSLFSSGNAGGGYAASGGRSLFVSGQGGTGSSVGNGTGTSGPVTGGGAGGGGRAIMPRRAPSLFHRVR